MEDSIPHSRPTLGQAEADAAAGVVASGNVATGEKTAQFEKALAQTVGAEGAVATSSGTAALFAALKALGVGNGDQVVVPSFVCTALLHAVWATGAEPVVCDIADHFNLSPVDVRAKLTGRTAAIILPHIFGTPAPVEEFLHIGPPVIEDCAQAVGAQVNGAKCGSFGAAAIFSFYATKMMTTGEGGMLTSSSQGLLGRARDLIEYDKKSDAVRRFNLKFNDIAAAVGLVQFSRLDEFIQDRRRIAATYDRELSGLDGIGLAAPAGSVYYRYVIEVADAADLILELRRRGVMAARPVDPPLHRIVGAAACPNTERAWKQAVSLPIYPMLTEAQTRRVASAVRQVVY